MSAPPTNRELFDAWRGGSQEAASLLFSRYEGRLTRLVRRRLSGGLLRRIDAEDVVLSAYRSFFLGATPSGTSRSEDGDGVWPLLMTITLRKLARQVRRHQAACRAVSREMSFEELAESGPSRNGHSGVDQGAMLADELSHLAGAMGETDRIVLQETLAGMDSVSVAKMLGVTDRTVRRMLARIKARAAMERPLSGFVPNVSHITTPLGRLPVSDWAVGSVESQRYRLLEYVGGGAFSKVYRSLDRLTGEVVAIKFLRRSCWDDVRAINSLRREYEILQTLSHPHILPVRGWGRTPRGATFLVTDFVDGSTLSRRISEGLLSVGQAVLIGRHIVEALGLAHANHVLHCDLTPSNTLLRANGQPVLCDFGFSRWVGHSEEAPRGGTAGFAAPEQMSPDRGPISPATDIYGFGGLMFAMLTGRAPFAGRDLQATIAGVLSDEAAVLPDKSPATRTPELAELILRCLSKRPDDRPASIGEVADRLELLSNRSGPEP